MVCKLGFTRHSIVIILKQKTLSTQEIRVLQIELFKKLHVANNKLQSS